LKAKYAGAIVMYIIANRNKKKYDIEDARVSLYEAMNEWLVAVGDNDFLGGTSPNTADVSVFGVIRSVEHLRYV
jgi:microsomal prostaglandin-E synthase 2